MYETEWDVFISNEADSLFCNTADLRRQEEGDRVRADILPRKTSCKLMEYALGQEVLASDFVLSLTAVYAYVYLISLFFCAKSLILLLQFHKESFSGDL